MLHTNVPQYRRAIIAVLSAVLLVGTCGLASAVTTASTNPHVIMIFTDDMGYGDISSFANNPFPARTPNIDRLASEGMKFTHFYVGMPICSPSRAAVLSSRFAPETGLTNFLQFRDGNRNSDAEDYMDPQHAHLPKTFKAAGYHTAHVGKWHMGGGRDVDNAPSIRKYGYDEAYSTWESPNPDPSLGIKYTPWDANTEPGQTIRHKRTEYMVNRTLEILRRNVDQPCFITLWPDDLHTPFRPSPEMMVKWGGVAGQDNSRENFYAVLDEYDVQIGRLLDLLKTEGFESNTIVFFTGDNGPAPDLGRERTNGMNGNKLSLYEGGIREPFIIRWPGRIPAGVTNDQTVLCSVDLLPTLAGLIGIPMLPQALAVTDGEDLSAAMLGTPVLRARPLMWEYGRTSTVPRPGVNDEDRSPVLAIREGDYKLLLEPNNTGHELYNVRTDPGEYNNLAAANPAIVQSMSSKILAWRATLPHRTQPYPVFGTVDFNQFTASHIAPAASLQAAAGAGSTLGIGGIAAAPHGEDDVFAIHVDLAGNEAFLRLDGGVGPIAKITDSQQIARDLMSPGAPISLVSGFDYSPGGDRLFFADNALGGGQISMLSLSVGTTSTTLIQRSSVFSGLNDHSVRPDGSIVGVRGAAGNRTIGSIAPATGTWTQQITEAQLMAAVSGATQIIPEAIGANSSSGEVHVFSHTTPALIKIADVATASGIVKLTQASLAGVDLHDVVADQAGNVFGYDQAGGRIVVIRKSDGAVFFALLSEIADRIGGSVPVAPTPWRGLAVRMYDTTHADLFIASSSSEYGVIRVRFGTPTAAVGEWMVY